MVLNEAAIVFEDVEKWTLKESFSLYIIPIVPHTLWEECNIPIPSGLNDKVIKVIKLKMATGVYKPSQSDINIILFLTYFGDLMQEKFTLKAMGLLLPWPP